MDLFQNRRHDMVEYQLKIRGIRDERVLHAMETTPRELFVPSHMRELAYEDHPLPIDDEQTISQPYIVALMAQLASIKPQDKVLEIGTGSGYSAAILSRLASSVDSIERFPTLSQKSEAVLRQLNITNVTVHLGDGSVGLEKNAPYDAIIVTAAAPVISPILLGQLKIEGRLVVPVGDYAGVQKLVRVTRRDGSTYDHEEIIDVRFVPLVGQEGFSS